MALQGFYVELMQRKDVRDFIETYHYSHNINGLRISYSFGLFNPEGTMVGAMVYGKLGMANAWKKYADEDGTEDDVLELRRLVLIDDTPRNAESFFVGRTVKWLKKNTDVKTIVSYADPNHGHSGIIYRASNFEHVGMTAPGRIIRYQGKSYHDKAIRAKYKGKFKPFALKLREALEAGEAYYEKQLPKHIYVYRLQ